MASPSSDLPPPPPGYAPPAGYAPLPAAPVAPAVPLSERLSPQSLASRGPWAFLAFLSQGIGLLLLFVGTLIVVVAGSYPISCIGSTACNAGTIQGILWGVETGRILWALGLFGLAAGAGLQLQFGMPNPPPTTPEGTRMYLARRRGEFALLVISILLLFLVMWIAALPTPGVTLP